MRNSTLGAKALSIMPPATITPLKMVTGRAPKFSTQTLQMGPGGRKEGRRENGVKSEKGVENTSGAEGQRRRCAADQCHIWTGRRRLPLASNWQPVRDLLPSAGDRLRSTYLRRLLELKSRPRAVVNAF